MERKEYGNDNPTINRKKSKKKQNNILKLVAVLAVAIVIVVFAIINSMMSGYEKPVHNYYKALNGKDAKTFVKIFPEKMEKAESSEKKIDTWAKVMDARRESHEKEYGKNIEIKHKIIEKKKYSEKELEESKAEVDEYLKGYYDEVIIQGGYDVAVRVTVSGDKNKGSFYTIWKVYKVNDDWFMMY